MARIGVIGLGFMGGRWARAVAEHSKAELAVVCDVDDRLARETAQTFGGSWSADPEATAADSTLHGVAICTPENLHEQLAVTAITAGHAVMVEKPIAHDIGAAERIRAAAHAADVPVLVGHILRFEPRYAAVSTAIAQGRIGAVQAIRSERVGVLGDQQVLKGRTSVPLYYGVHELDLARWYAGGIDCVAAFRSRGVLHTAGYDVEDLYSLSLRFTSGAHGTSMLGWSQPTATAVPGLSGFTVIGEDGYLRVDQGSNGLTAFDTSGAFPLDTWYAPDVHGLTRGALAIEADHFVRVVCAETDPLCTATDGTEALRASLAAERAAALGRIVDIAEVMA